MSSEDGFTAPSWRSRDAPLRAGLRARTRSRAASARSGRWRRRRGLLRHALRPHAAGTSQPPPARPPVARPAAPLPLSSSTRISTTRARCPAASLRPRRPGGRETVLEQLSRCCSASRSHQAVCRPCPQRRPWPLGLSGLPSAQLSRGQAQTQCFGSAEAGAARRHLQNQGRQLGGALAPDRGHPSSDPQSLAGETSGHAAGARRAGGRPAAGVGPLLRRESRRQEGRQEGRWAGS